MARPLVAVLAGGRGRRMGASKPAFLLAGRPLVAWPLAAARAAGLDAVVVAKRATALPALDVPVWLEPDAPSHPLCGLVHALERAGGPVVAVACDQPFLTGGLLAALAGRAAPVTVCAPGGELEPFPGRYAATVLPALRAALAAEPPLRRTLAALAPETLGDAELRAWGDPARLVAGLNTPEAVAAAAASLGSSAMPNAEQWLEAFAAALGRPAPTQAEMDAVLALASTAAHASERRAAPIACWLAATVGADLARAEEIADRLDVRPGARPDGPAGG